MGATPDNSTLSKDVIRFICGFVFGVLLSLGTVVSDVPVAIAIAIPFVTGVAAVAYGDRFWRGILGHLFVWWP